MSKTTYTAVFLAAMLLVSGCRSAPQPASESKAADEGNRQPVELSIYQQSAKLSDEEFRQLIAEPVKRKYPHITMQLVRADKNKMPEDLITAGQVPDMAFLSPGALMTYEKLKIVEALDPYVKKNNLDLSRFDTDSLTAIHNICGADRLCALPFSANPAVLFYNKDIFDKFGIPYPKDGMTWDDAIDTAKKVTRVSDGTQYKGLNTGLIGWMDGQLSTPLVIPSTNQVNLLDDNFKKSFQKFMDIERIPGNERIGDQVNAFLKEQNTAMLTYYMGGVIGPLVEINQQGKSFDWDMVSVPTFKEAPKKSFPGDYHLLVMSATSKHKEEVMQVMQLLTGKEAQLEMTRQGRVSALKDVEVRGHFGENVPVLKGKNLNAAFINESANVPYHEYNEWVSPRMNAALRDVVAGKKDINTALREAQEAANQAIKDAISKK